jgi:hypothetical protein
MNLFTVTGISIQQYIWPDVARPPKSTEFLLSGLVQVECTEALYNDNPEIQNLVEIGDLVDVFVARR